VIARFGPAAARILVIQPSPYVRFEPRTILPNNTFGGGRVLLRPHDRGIDRHRPIDPASGVGLGLDHSQQHVPGPVGSETMMPLPHRLPRAKPLEEITPRHPGAIRVLLNLDPPTPEFLAGWGACGAGLNRVVGVLKA
jgi:hypothetical protein